MNPDTQALEESAAVDGRSARWAQHREQRRAEMLDVARRLIHAQGPDVTMEDIASASSTSKSIVYRYFADKAQLQRAIGMHILSGMHRRLVAELEHVEEASGRAAGPEQRIRAMISAYVNAAETSPNVYRFVTRPSEGLNHFLTSVARLVATALPEGADPRLAQVWSAGAVGFVQGSVDRWMHEGEDDASDPVPGDSGPPGARADAPRGARPTSDQLTDQLVAWLMSGIAHPSKETTR